MAVPAARHVYAADRRWWRRYRSEVTARHPDARLWTVPDFPGPGRKVWRAEEAPKAEPGVTMLSIDMESPGISRTPGLIHSGKNSGYQAINLAVLLGFTTLLLVGFDMRRVGGKQHFFGEYPDASLARPSPYHEWIPLFRTIKPDGFEVINCTPGSAIDAFPFGRLEDYV